VTKKKNFKLFGDRVLVEQVKAKQGTIYVPENEYDLSRIGRVVTVADGTRPGRDPVNMLVKEGDLVYFQTNMVMQSNLMYDMGDEIYMNLMQAEIVAKLDSNDITLDTFHVIGDWVLCKPFMKDGPVGIVLPEASKKAMAVYFRLIDKGSTVDLDINEGDELVLTHGRAQPFQIQKEDYVYIHKNEIHGIVEESRILT
jgi:co-chaperonin GroES (HSP10)